MYMPANAPAGVFQVSQPFPVFTPADKYWYRYCHGTPLDVIHPTSLGPFASPNSRRACGKAVAADRCVAGRAGMVLVSAIAAGIAQQSKRAAARVRRKATR